jgi:hypothetical protein
MSGDEVIGIGFIVGVIVLLVMAILFGFHNSSVNHEWESRRINQMQLPSENGMYVFELDSHEYLYVVSGRDGGICHKADCRYCKRSVDK